MIGALIAVPAGVGYPLLFALVAGESAGALVPGETSLIVAAALAARGQLSVPLVIGVAAGAAIVSDNIGYAIGPWGSAAVFFGRWLPGLRVVASWLAGADRMPWPRFLLWNALCGISWATSTAECTHALGWNQ